jgi:hypothetical protein
MKTKILFAAFAVIITGAVTMTKANVENKAVSKSVQVTGINKYEAAVAQKGSFITDGSTHDWTFVTGHIVYSSN